MNSRKRSKKQSGSRRKTKMEFVESTASSSISDSSDDVQNSQKSENDSIPIGPVQLSNYEQSALNLIEAFGDNDKVILNIYHDFVLNRKNKTVMHNVHIEYFGPEVDPSELMLEHSYVLLKKWLDMKNVKYPDNSELDDDLQESMKVANYVAVMEFVLVNMVKYGFISTLVALCPTAVEIYKDLMKLERNQYSDYFFQFDLVWRKEFISRHDYCGLFESHFLDNTVDFKQRCQQLELLENEVKKNEVIMKYHETNDSNNGKRGSKSKSISSEKVDQTSAEKKADENDVDEWKRCFPFFPKQALTAKDKVVKKKEKTVTAFFPVLQYPHEPK